MLIKEQVILSFVKGIAKTSGVVTILALVGGIWYIANEKIKRYTGEIKESVKEDRDVIVEDNVLSTKEDTMSYVEDINIEDNGESSKFKHIFDKMIL